MEFSTAALAIHGLIVKLLERREAAEASQELRGLLEELKATTMRVAATIEAESSLSPDAAEALEIARDTFEIVMRLDQELLPEVLTKLLKIEREVLKRPPRPEVKIESAGGGGNKMVSGKLGFFYSIHLTALNDHLHDVELHPDHNGTMVGPPNTVGTLVKEKFQLWELKVAHPGPKPLSVEIRFTDSYEQRWTQKWDRHENLTPGNSEVRWIRHAPTRI